MQFRTISWFIAAFAVGACGTAPDPTSESLAEELRKDGGQHCRPSAPGEVSPCGNSGSGDHGKSDASKGRGGDGGDDDDDYEDGGRKGNGKGGKKDGGGRPDNDEY